jgi:phage terminase large subunit
MTESEELALIYLLEQEERERLSPKFEQIKTTEKNIIIAQGGRGAGAKSWSVSSEIIQMCQYEHHRVACLREIQKSLVESVHQLIQDQIDRLKYPNWKITDEYIENTKTDSHIIFRGLKDIRAAHQIKSLEGYDVFWIEEASVVSAESLRIIMPTLVRQPWWRLFITYNPETEEDPVTVRFWNSDREDMLKIRVEPGLVDNPWWSPGLQNEMEIDYARDPDEAEHVWGGNPRKQGQNAVLSRVLIRQAMARTIEAVGAEEVGVDVARFGDDKTEMYKRKGMKIIGHRSFSGQDTVRTANEAWDLAGRRPDIRIKVDDTGVGGGVTDNLRRLGATVVPVEFGGSPLDKDKYTSVADEMWFEFAIDEADIPDDTELMSELSGRRYDYDNKGRKKIEEKKVYKERLGRSPDRADALLLTYYKGHIDFGADIRKQMAARRAKGK